MTEKDLLAASFRYLDGLLIDKLDHHCLIVLECGGYDDITTSPDKIKGAGLCGNIPIKSKNTF
jgi:hypothetical protein